MIRQRGEEPMRQAFYRMSGADLTAIDAVGVGIVEVTLTGPFIAYQRDAALLHFPPTAIRFPKLARFREDSCLAPASSFAVLHLALDRPQRS